MNRGTLAHLVRPHRIYQKAGISWAVSCDGAFETENTELYTKTAFLVLTSSEASAEGWYVRQYEGTVSSLFSPYLAGMHLSSTRPSAKAMEISVFLICLHGQWTSKPVNDPLDCSMDKPVTASSTAANYDWCLRAYR